MEQNPQPPSADPHASLNPVFNSATCIALVHQQLLKPLVQLLGQQSLLSKESIAVQLLPMLHRKLHYAFSVFRNAESVSNHLKTLTTERKKYIVEFSSPNIAKPFHFGHLRSTVIGNFISNLLSALDHEVIRINYLGDFGTQFGLLSVGYDRYGSEEKLLQNPCKHLLDVYVSINREAELNEEIRREGKERFRALEAASDDRILKQWNRFRELSAHHYQHVYGRLGISFDHTHYESMYSGMVSHVINKVKEKGFLHEASDGAKMMRIRDDETRGMPKRRSRNQPKINEQNEGSEDPELIPLVKKDGTSLYLSRDVAAAIDRKSRFNFDHMLYVVETGQQGHFADLKRILKSLDFEWNE